MKFEKSFFRAKALSLATLIGAANLQTIPSPFTPAAHGAEADKASAGDKAWAEVEKALRPPNFPEEWQKNRPSQAEYAKFILPHMMKSARAAIDFSTKFPTHAKAADAKKRGYELLGNAATLGSEEAIAEVKKKEEADLKDTKLSSEDRFKIRASQVQRAAMAKQSEGMNAVFSEYEAGARKLLTEFPDRNEPYEMLLEVAGGLESEKGLKLAQELVAGKAPAEVKAQAEAIIKKMDRVGKPLPIKFKALDGREIDVANMKGKVVLVDFWATWCGPCVQEVPNVVAAYEKLHPKGFEIVGISFDQSKESLTKFIADNKMPWAQYFDGKGWQNEIGGEYGIRGIPAMWLVDKKGNLRDLNGRENLEEKVAKLLAE